MPDQAGEVDEKADEKESAEDDGAEDDDAAGEEAGGDPFQLPRIDLAASNKLALGEKKRK